MSWQVVPFPPGPLFFILEISHNILACEFFLEVSFYLKKKKSGTIFEITLSMWMIGAWHHFHCSLPLCFSEAF